MAERGTSAVQRGKIQGSAEGGGKTLMDWHELAVTSHYQTARAIKQELMRGNLHEAMTGIAKLEEALSRSDTRELRSQLIRLMAHIITWKTPPERRSRGWAITIENTRIEIEELLEIEPSLRASTPDLLKELFEKAKRSAEQDMNRKTTLTGLAWEEVFDEEYTL